MNAFGNATVENRKERKEERREKKQPRKRRNPQPPPHVRDAHRVRNNPLRPAQPVQVTPPKQNKPGKPTGRASVPVFYQSGSTSPIGAPNTGTRQLAHPSSPSLRLSQEHSPLPVLHIGCAAVSAFSLPTLPSSALQIKRDLPDVPRKHQAPNPP